MLALTTPVSIQNVTRIKVTSAPVPDLDVSDYMQVTVAVLGPPAGQTAQVQLAKAYATHNLKIRNGQCDSLSFNTSDATLNQYNGQLIVRGSVTNATLLDTCIAAMNAAGNNPRNQHTALENALSAAGVLPAGTAS